MPELCDQLNTGRIHRRDFLRQACLLGVTATTAYAMADTLTGETFMQPAFAATPEIRRHAARLHAGSGNDRSSGVRLG